MSCEKDTYAERSKGNNNVGKNENCIMKEAMETMRAEQRKDETSEGKTQKVQVFLKHY